jgi:hypothetical protein
VNRRRVPIARRASRAETTSPEVVSARPTTPRIHALTSLGAAMLEMVERMIDEEDHGRRPSYSVESDPRGAHVRDADRDSEEGAREDKD